MQAPNLAGGRELGPEGLPPPAYPGGGLSMPALEALLRTAPEVNPGWGVKGM